MWIMTNNSYLSIVSKDCGPAELLVRARRAGDIEKVFPDAKVTRTTNRDYLYRAVLPRDVVKQAVAAMIDHIDYPNFKDSGKARWRSGSRIVLASLPCSNPIRSANFQESLAQRLSKGITKRLKDFMTLHQSK
jgi:hypothetical protein